MPPRTSALLLALLMTAPILPLPEAAATHAEGVLTAPTLPPVRPDSECAETAVPAHVLGGVDPALRGNATTYFAWNGTVPLLCVFGQPVQPYRDFVRQADRILDAFRNATREIQRQVDRRAEPTVPVGQPIDWLRPTVPILEDKFNGTRRGGFGNWTVVTRGGESEAWRLEQWQSVNGTEGKWRFGDDAGYARGVHQWLVSPELDLTPVKNDEAARQALLLARQHAREDLRRQCNEGRLNANQEPLLSDWCGDDASIPFSGPVDGAQPPPFRQIFQAYEAAFDDVLRDVPVMRESAVLELKYRANFAAQVDGVRVWLYRGTRAPERVELFSESFGRAGETQECTLPYRDGATGIPEPDRIQCTPRLSGGKVLHELPGAKQTVAFREDAPLSRGDPPSNRNALTGDTEWVSVRVNLTEYAGERLWLLFEAKTTPESGREESFFDSPGVFKRQKEYGFELAFVNATGETYLRNFRLKDVAGELPPVREPNAHGDNATRVSLAAPGRAGFDVRIQNAGLTHENGTVVLRVHQVTLAGDALVAEEWMEARDVRPGEVRTLRFPIDVPLVKGALYRVNATLHPQEFRGVNSNNLVRDPNRTLEPEATPVRLNNSAHHGLGGNLSHERLVRADEQHALAAVRAAGGGGPAIEICSDVSPSHRCTQSYAARKGEPRIVLMGIRNDGTAPVTVKATLRLSLEGSERGHFILDEATRDVALILPGETRPVSWTLNPADPGAYDAEVFVRLADGTLVAQASRIVYVQRSTGLVCFDDFNARRECGPGFQADRPEILAGADVTAAGHDAQGNLLLATQVRAQGGLLAKRTPEGDWSELARLPGADANRAAGGWGSIRDMLAAPDGTLYLVGGNRTVLARAPSGALVGVPLNDTVDHTDLRAAAWWNGTLYVAGTNGTLLKMISGKLEPEPLTSSSCAGGQVVNATYAGAINALAVFGPRLYAAGQGGALFTATANRPWLPVTSADADTPAYDLGGNPSCAGLQPGLKRDLHALIVHGGTLYAAGDHGVLLHNATGQARVFALSAPVPMPGFHARAGFVSHLGEVHLLGADGSLAACADCRHRRDGQWTFPELPVPSIPRGSDYARALLLAASPGPATTTVAGQGGVVLDLARRGAFDNEGDWTVVNPLVPHDGGILQTHPTLSSAPSALRFEPDDAGRSVAANSTQIRITINHFAKRASERFGGEIRALFEDYPNLRFGGKAESASGVTFCPRNRFDANSPDAQEVDMGSACQRDEIMRTLQQVRAPTASDRWERLVFEIVPPSLNPTASGSRQTLFSGVEFFREDGAAPADPRVEWAVDDILVEGKVGGQWRTILAWYGPDDRMGLTPTTARLAPRGAFEEADMAVGRQVVRPLNSTATDIENETVAASEWVLTNEAFGFEPRSAWHLSTALADRPVFALNDELMADGLSAPGEPHLRSDWNARLISPVLDLGEAHDPVVSFRHLYAFRTYSQTTNDGVTRYQHGDTGRLEIQWLKEGPEECPGMAPGQTCGWSAFHPVSPAAGYPNAAANGYGSVDPLPETADQETYMHDEHADWGVNLEKPSAPGKSWWGRNMEPNDRNVIEAARSLSNYQEVRVNIKDHECGLFPKTGCLPGLSGRKVRVAFHVITAPNVSGYYHLSNDQVTSRTSFGGEGWYVADFKVLGARTLGIDLRAENLTFPVGFDWQRIGVGPGTKVPVNVTVANRGAFEALGYTGELVVRKVVDPLDLRADVVDRLVLGQQPEIAPGARVNHTLWWSVPADEGAAYLLELEIRPLGIARDEDFTDNLARIGTFGSPVPARTFRDHRVEMLVTPENATTDITRYVPIYIHNTGNVPQAGFTLTREITLLQGPQTRVVDRRVFTTERPVPQGARVPLAAVATLNPTDDLFWKAPERANYLFTLGSLADDGRRAGAEKRVSAFATFLFDDVEGGPRGEATSGGWAMGNGWARVETGGFRSPKSVAFGDVDAQRHPSGVDASLVTPVVDLSGARSARVAFYQRYKFEPGFDAGVLEASSDGGRTWTRLDPLPDPLNGLPKGYVDATPVSAASPLDPDGDPLTPSLAFTGESAALPGAVEGWTLAQFDLTRYANATEADVAYESYRSEQLEDYRGTGRNDTLSPANRRPAVATETSWMVGREDAQRYWEVQNLGHESVRSIVGNASFWWSGSASLADDGKRPLGNHALNVTIDLTHLRADDGKTVVVEWWEWLERHNEHMIYRVNPGGSGEISKAHLQSVATFHTGRSSQSWRFNLSEPVLVEKDGKWMKFTSDLTAQKGNLVHVEFVYSPILRPVSNTQTDLAALELDDNRYRAAHLDDRGFAIDGFTVKTVRVVNGQPSSEIVLGESAAWARARQYDCDRPGTAAPLTRDTFGSDAYACFGTNRLPHVERPVLLPGEGRSWTLVETLPRVPASWGVVAVRDAEGRDEKTRLPTGAVPSAWWTGDTRSSPDRRCVDALLPCQVPGSESRLVTPVIDLGRIAGEEALLTFDHRYAFHTSATAIHPFASGGVVEIQEQDPQTGAWGPWKQIYERPDAKVLPASGSATDARDGAGEGLFGGYSGYTVNDSRTVDNKRKRHDAPFEPVWSPRAKQDVQFLYTGNSSALTGTRTGWVDARYDVSDHVGKKVRFGFHAYFSPVPSNTGALGHLREVIPETNATDGPRGGWWIANVEIVGTILRADPILLRLRAAADANVDEGYWQVDDFGVFGARYGRAVGVFADESRTWGAILNQTVTIPITIRNMGDSVRRDLAVEVRMDPPQRVTFNASAPKGAGMDGDVYRMMGFTLGPGRSATVNLTIRAPAESPVDALRSSLLVSLKEFNPSVEGFAGDPFEDIPDNEVQGILARTLRYESTKTANVTFGDFRASPAVGRVGEPVLLNVTAVNVGHVRAEVNLTCTAETIQEWVKQDHARSQNVDRPIVKAASACERVGPSPLVEPGATAVLTFRALPQAEGFLRFTLDGRLVAGNATRALAHPLTAMAAVERSPVAFVASFPNETFVKETWRSLGGTGDWSARGSSARGSLLIGISDERASGTTHDYSEAIPPYTGANRSALTPPIDLHNYSREAVYLTFQHQDRFARWDGGQVYAQVKTEEHLPVDAGWTEPCLLTPVGGYEGFVLSFIPNGSSDNTPRDVNPGAQWGKGVVPAEDERHKRWFVSDGPNGGTPEDTWTRAVFNLSDQPGCPSLQGRSVRFEFRTSVGSPFGTLRRGLGQGWLIDDLSVGPINLEIRPGEQRGLLLDNTTKQFSVLVRNRGAFPDEVRLAFDEANSSTPPGSVRLSESLVRLDPGETRRVLAQITLPRDPSLLPASFKARVLAQSLLDPHASDSTVVDVLFAPRAWPELALSATAPLHGGFAGAETFIPIVVENQGLVESRTVNLRITDRWAGGETVTVLEIPSMPGFYQKGDEASRTLEFRWRPAEGSLGEHVLVLEIDPEGVGEEYTRTNNVLVLAIPVGELPLPDLDVAPERALALRNALGSPVEGVRDADVTRYEVTAGELVTFELRVLNKGRAGATNVNVRAAIGPLNLPSKTIPYVAPGAEVAVTFNWLAQKGEYALDFRVLTEQFELTTANNMHPERGVALLTVKGFEVGVSLDAPLGILPPGSAQRVPFTLVNTGNSGEELRLVGVAPRGVRLEPARDAIFLRAGETFESFALLSVDDDAVAGPQFISIEAVARDNPMKAAAARARIEVEAIHGGSVDSARVERAPPLLVVPVTLHNEGNSLEPWHVRLDLPAGWSAREQMPLAASVPPRGAATVEFHVSVPAGTAPGPRQLVARASLPDGETRQGTITVDVRPLRAAAFTLAASEPSPSNGTLAYPLAVENRGNVKQPFQMVLVGVPAGVEARVEPALFTLAPGERAQATLLLDPAPGVRDGTYAITGYAHFAGVAPDGEEGRANVQSLRVELARPDLALGVVEAVPRVGVAVGDRVSVKASVLNGGPATVLDLPVHLYVDDVFITETRIARLGPGGRAEISLNWTALPGEHVLTLVVDPWKDAPDVDREDNAASVLVQVDAAGAVGGLVGGRTGIPGPGALLVLLALVGAALLAVPLRGPRRPRK